MKDYVKWANTLDSAGSDSSAVKARINSTIVRDLNEAIWRFIQVSERVDKIKKHLYYGRAYVVEGTGDPSVLYDAPTERLKDHEIIRLLHGILGKIDEAGELAIAFRDFLMDGDTIDPVNIIEEVGDSQWYDAIICKWLGFDSFDPIQIANYKKLVARYPDLTWTQGHALNRDLGKEYEALEDAGLNPGSNTPNPPDDEIGEDFFPVPVNME